MTATAEILETTSLKFVCVLQDDPNAQQEFLTDLSFVSHELVNWARAQFNKGRSLKEVKASIRSAMDACGRAA